MVDLDRLIASDTRAWQAHVDRLEEDTGLVDLPASGHPLRHRGRRPQRKSLAAILVAVVILAVLAIGVYVLVSRGDNGAGPASPLPATVSASTDPKIPQQPLQPLSFPLVETLSADQARTLTSGQWRLVAIHDAQRTIQIYFFAGDGSCSTPAGIFVQETATTVLVEALLKIDQSQQNCPSRELLGGATIRLHAPLGTRTLLHAQVKPGYDHILQ